MHRLLKQVISVPLYIIGLTMGAIGLCIILPGCMLVSGALGVAWVADFITLPREWRR